jgi:hypothetical protein
MLTIIHSFGVCDPKEIHEQLLWTPSPGYFLGDFCEMCIDSLQRTFLLEIPSNGWYFDKRRHSLPKLGDKSRQGPVLSIPSFKDWHVMFVIKHGFRY